MNVRNRLRNNLIWRLLRLSTDRLAEVNELLGKIEARHSSKEKTLQFAGAWKDLDADFYADLIEDLHTNRAADRPTFRQ